MGYLLKQALNTLCRLNHWSYAVFWKFGLQNAKLLIWEECYYGTGNPDSWSGAPAGDMVQYLVNKMMMENHVNILGRGLVGRVAFTGNPQWMLAENYNREVHPPEVLKEVYQQFSAGMQTVAVIPVLPHGVIQFGSCLRIVENMEFVNDVVSLVSQLGHVPGVLQSHGYSTESCPMNADASSFAASELPHTLAGFRAEDSSMRRFQEVAMDGATKAEVMPSTFEAWMNQDSIHAQLDETNSVDAFALHRSGDDLFDILGAEFKTRLLSSSQNGSGPSNHLAVKMHDYSDNAIFSTGTDYLLDAVVSNVHPCVDRSLDDDVSCRTALANASTSAEVKALVNSTEKRSSPPKEDTTSYSQCSSIYDSWFEKGHQMKQSSSASTGYSKNKGSRKRLKPGESPRPRPKDRQMIQDRLKELREIIPNGAKCSIDALLERTIKHMCFLQSLSKHANKLKLTAESKIVSKDGGLLLKDNFEGGATWAYEVGSESMVCPIIVEDLNQPRQMLVEMLCEERGLFLEIADVIRGLGLTILKGLMVTRNDKIWARFSVEANRDITRMEIFVSLVRLLQHNAEISMIPEDAMVQQFHTAESIPGTIKIC